MRSGGWRGRWGSHSWWLLMLWLAGVALMAAAPPASARPDVRVVVDVSGSMKAHDPDRLAASAMGLLVSLLPEGASAGVWTFGERIDNPLPLGRVESAWRERALGLPPALRDYQQYTDIEAALRRASEAEANGGRHLILMTDGVIDLPPARGAKPAIDRDSRRRLMEELAPTLADQGVAVHAIAFSDEADLALVERLAQNTGGLASRVDSPEGLLGAFLDIFERIFPADRLPLDDEGRFIVDEGVDSLSALVFHEPDAPPLTLVAPDGTRYQAETAPEGANWQVEPRFDLIRLPEPQAGEWRLEGAVGERSRISVSGAWHLRTSPLPATLYRGFPVPVEAWLEAESDAVDLPGNLTFEVALEGADGEEQSLVTLDAEADGRYMGELPPPDLTGNARLVVRASGEGFTRQRSQAVNVLPAIGAVHDPAAERVVLAAEHPRLTRGNTRIRGDLRGESLTAEAVGEARWTLSLPALDPELRQPLALIATITLDGQTRELNLPRLMLNPDARIGIAGTEAGPTLAAERFAGPDDPAAPDASSSLADRFVEGVNAVPAKLRLAWQAGWPGLVERARGWAAGPWLWGLAVLAGCLLLLGLLRHRRRRSKVHHHREDPYV
ncbi:VWA domain-containing protein [Halomonas sp. THAF12]|uniref:vWA domain-containing protein n=1 Tax=Halomonas sp. B23F22_10 TaxID=3459515 RepID=UPI00373EBAED